MLDLAEPNASGTARITRCSDVTLPPNTRLYESYFHADASSGLLRMRFLRTGPGNTRPIAYTVQYQTDMSCRERPKLAAILSRVTAEGLGSVSDRRSGP